MKWVYPSSLLPSESFKDAQNLRRGVVSLGGRELSPPATAKPSPAFPIESLELLDDTNKLLEKLLMHTRKQPP